MDNYAFDGRRPTYSQLLDLVEKTPLEQLCKIANALREKYLGNFVDTCAIMNARSGRCSEDCKWCAQSAHNPTGCKVYAAVSPDEALEFAKKAKQCRVRRFSLVTSGRKLSDEDTQKMAEAFRKMSELGGLGLCGSFGLLTKQQFQILYQAGMRRFHCNLETAPSFFPKLCSTHTIDDKIASIKAAKEVGMSICSGGIIGMGESLEQRVELACTLADLEVDSIPLNILQPIKNTPLQDMRPLSKDEILQAVALFKIANPRAHLRFAGGRSWLRGFQDVALRSGASGFITGDMLTTHGSAVAEDFKMLESLGYEF